MKLAWGDFIAIVLPGALVLLGVALFSGPLAEMLARPNSLTIPGGLFLLVASALAGGMLEGVRRVALDFIAPKLRRRSEPTDEARKPVFYYLTPENASRVQ